MGKLRMSCAYNIHYTKHCTYNNFRVHWILLWCSDKVGTRLMNNPGMTVQTEQYKRAHNIYIYACDYIIWHNEETEILIRNESRVHSHHNYEENFYYPSSSITTPSSFIRLMYTMQYLCIHLLAIICTNHIIARKWMHNNCQLCA